MKDLPTDQRKALSKTLSHACTMARAIGWNGERMEDGPTKDMLLQLSQIMDIVHNIPEALFNPTHWNHESFLTSLKYYEEPFGIGSQLSRIYSDSLNESKPLSEQDE